MVLKSFTYHNKQLFGIGQCPPCYLVIVGKHFFCLCFECYAFANVFKSYLRFCYPFLVESARNKKGMIHGSIKLRVYVVEILYSTSLKITQHYRVMEYKGLLEIPPFQEMVFKSSFLHVIDSSTSSKTQ